MHDTLYYHNISSTSSYTYYTLLSTPVVLPLLVWGFDTYLTYWTLGTGVRKMDEAPLSSQSDRKLAKNRKPLGESTGPPTVSPGPKTGME